MADIVTVDSPRPRDVDAEQFALIKMVGAILHQSRYYQGIATPEQAAYLMARSYELGFPATAAPDVIDNIQGRLTLKPQAAWALVLRSGLVEDMEVEEDEGSCTIRFKRRGLPFWQGYTFTMDAARKADLVKTGGAYEKWGKNMLYWRAMGFALDRVFPDVTLGMKDSVQFGAAAPSERVDADTGEVVIVDAQEA